MGLWPADGAHVITVLGSNPVAVMVGEVYTDAGATAADTVSGTAALTTVNPVNTSVPATYTVSYSAVDGAGNVANATRTVYVVAPTITAARTFVPAAYPSPGVLDVMISFADSDAAALTALKLSETIPSGWTFAGVVGGSAPSTVPSVGAKGTLSFVWGTVPSVPFSFTYRLNVPARQTGSKTFSGLVTYRKGGPDMRVTFNSTIARAPK